MLLALGNHANKDLLIIGLSHENLARLKNNEPAMQEISYGGKPLNVFLFAQEKTADLAPFLKEKLGFSFECEVDPPPIDPSKN